MFIRHKKLAFICLILAFIGVFWVVNTAFFNKVEWVPVEKVTVKENFTVSGNIEALNKIDYKAPFSGRILLVPLREGDYVNKGTLIARYEKDKILSQLEQLDIKQQQATLEYNKMRSGFRKEEIQKAESAYKNALVLLKEKKLMFEKQDKDLSKYQQLYQEKLISQKDFEDFTKELEISKESFNAQKELVELAKKDFELYKNGYRKEDVKRSQKEIQAIQAEKKIISADFNKTDILSPVTGQIILRNVDPEQDVLAGELLFRIIDKNNLEITAAIEEEDLGSIKINDHVDIIADAYPNKTFKGVIKSISENVIESSRLVPVKLTIIQEKINPPLIPGMTVSCTFAGHNRDYLTVPKDSVQREGKKFFVETENGKIYLEVGKSHGDKVIVKGAVTLNDKVLIK